MSEYWRIKKYYDKRVLIDTESILASPFSDSIVCLSGAQLDMLRNLTQYLHRRSTFAQDYDTAHYLAPSNDDWDIIQSIVADLEDTLMGCDIDALVLAIEQQTVVLTGLMTCVCEITNYQRDLASRLPDLTGYVDGGDASWDTPANTEAGHITPPNNIIRCEYAQSIYYFTHQLYTETLLPFADESADTLVAAIISASAFGAVAGFVGIPAFILATLVTFLVAWAISGAIADFTNWLIGNKDELICILYTELPSYSAAAAAMTVFIDTDVDLSYLDKQVLKAVIASTWFYSWIIADQEQNGTWDSYFVTGLCDLCPSPSFECVDLNCIPGNWSGIPPGELGCSGGYPYAVNAFPIKWVDAAPRQLDANFLLEVDWTAQGDSGMGILGCDLVSKGTLTQINVAPPSTQPVGERKIESWELFSPATQGEELQIRLAQSAWFGIVHSYCIKPIPPPALAGSPYPFAFSRGKTKVKF